MPLNTLQCMGQPPTMKNSLPWNGNGARAEECWFRYTVSWFNVNKIITTALYLRNIKSSSIRLNSRPLIPYVHLHPVFCLFPLLERRWTYGILGHLQPLKIQGLFSISLLHRGESGRHLFIELRPKVEISCALSKNSECPLFPAPSHFHISLLFPFISPFLFPFFSFWCDSIWKSQNVSFVQFNSFEFYVTHIYWVFLYPTRKTFFFFFPQLLSIITRVRES